jgi:Lysyl oxidase/Dockerin type I domain/Bacterial Ig-like domain
MSTRWFSARRSDSRTAKIHRTPMRLLTLEDRVNPTQLLPDLFPLGSGHLTNWTVSTTGGVSTLKYETAMANWGQGPFEMRATGQFRTNVNGTISQLINQRIYNSDSTTTDVPAGWFDYNPSDGYIHFNDMAHANIRIRTAGDGLGDIVATGVKTSYCLIDIQHSNPGLPGSPSSSHYNTCGSVMQGISVGWNDVYGSGLNGQSVNVTGLPNGNYWLEDVADALGAIQETDETNNATRVAITLSTLPTVGVRVLSTSPTGAAPGAVPYVDVNFNQMMDGTTFTPADVSLTGPGGAVAIDSVEQLNTVSFRIHFATQGPIGTYQLTVGPHISSVGGVEMDQNNNGTPGEAGDALTTTFSIAAPRVAGFLPTGQTTAPVSSIRVTYNKPMQSSTLTTADIFSFTGPAGVNLLGQVTGITPVTPGGLSASFDIGLASNLTATGPYTMVLEPTVLDEAGNPVDQNGDGQSNNLDRYTNFFGINPSGLSGPDGFGYDSSSMTTQSLELFGQSGTTSITFSNTDNGSASIPLGTNTFNFYGTSYTGSNQLFISTNGLLTFGSGNTASANNDMTTLTQPAIAVLWDDLIKGPGTPQALYKMFDDDANGIMDRIVIEWYQVAHSGGSPSPMTFQAVLQLNTGATPGGIFLNYQDLNTGDGNGNGASATVGLHKPVSGGKPFNFLVSLNGSNSFVTDNSAQKIGVPRVLSITRELPNPFSAPGDAEFEVTFDHPMTNVLASDFFVTTTGTISGANIHYILPTSDPAVWYVYCRSGYGTGTLRLGLTDDDSIRSTYGARLGGLGLGNGNFNASEVYDVVQRAPQIQGFTLDDGTAQRSTIRQIVVTFDMLVNFVGNPSNAFQLTGPNGPVAVTVDTSMSPPTQTVAKLTFSGAGTEFGSVSDGNYTLQVVAANVQAGGVNMAANGSLSFFRFFGDVNGDRHIDIADFGIFSSTFNLSTGQTGFIAAFDYNNDGHIDILDFGQFSVRLFTVLP